MKSPFFCITLLGAVAFFAGCRRAAITVKDNAPPSTAAAVESGQSQISPLAAPKSAVAVVAEALKTEGRAARLDDSVLSAALESDWRVVADAINALPVGARRSALVEQVLRVAPKEVVTSLLAHFEDSSLPEDQRRARDALFERSHELPYEVLLDLAASIPKRPPPQEGMHPIAVATAARRLVESQGLSAGLATIRNRLPGDSKPLQEELVASLFQTARPSEILQEFPSHAAALDWRATYEIGRHLGRNSSTDIAAWIRERGQAPEAPWLVRGFVGGWLNREPTDASQWVGALPTGKIRDIAAKEVANYSLDNGDREAARRWLESIGDAEIQAEVRNRLEKVPR